MSDTITKLPQIRFSGFTDDWEQRELDSITDRVKSYSLSRDVETIEDTGYKYVHYGDIHTKVADVIDEFSNLPNINAGNYDLLEKGDLVVADASEDYQGIATPAVITLDTPYKLVAGLHTIALRPKQVDSLFLYYLFKSPTFRKYGYKTGTGMKVFGISVSNLLKFEGMFPLLQEQIKIGNFLKKIDETLALHQRKLELLKDTKKSLLQKMFPKNGANVPEIRFAGFTDAWEQRMLGDYIIPYSEVTTENNQYPVFTSSRKGLFFQTDYYDGNQIASEDNTGYNIVPRGYFTYRHMSDDLVFKFNINNLADNGIVSTLYPVFTTTESLDSRYLQYQLNEGEEFKRFAILQKQGGSRTYMYLSKLKNMKLTMPNLDEQIEIRNFFKQIDDTIALHQRELNSLENLKKSLLQQMFV